MITQPQVTREILPAVRLQMLSYRHRETEKTFCFDFISCLLPVFLLSNRQQARVIYANIYLQIGMLNLANMFTHKIICHDNYAG